jgi:hypothetical protein
MGADAGALLGPQCRKGAANPCYPEVRRRGFTAAEVADRSPRRVGKRGLIFRILSEVGVFLHVNLADGILYLHWFAHVFPPRPLRL